MSPVFVYFSLSTTGTSFTDNILQIGGITHDQTMKFNAHILPDCPIHPHASQEHGIYLEHDNNFHEDLLVKDNTVLDARPPRDVLEAFANFLDSVHMEFGYRDIVLVCYNGIQWGGRVLLREFDRYEVCFPVSVVGISDPMRMAVMLFPGLPAGYKQLQIQRFFGIDLTCRHSNTSLQDAYLDSIVLVAIVKKMLNNLNDNRLGKTIFTINFLTNGSWFKNVEDMWEKVFG